VHHLQLRVGFFGHNTWAMRITAVASELERVSCRDLGAATSPAQLVERVVDGPPGVRGERHGVSGRTAQHDQERHLSQEMPISRCAGSHQTSMHVGENVPLHFQAITSAARRSMLGDGAAGTPTTIGATAVIMGGIPNSSRISAEFSAEVAAPMQHVPRPSAAAASMKFSAASQQSAVANASGRRAQITTSVVAP
jgi:hypothetical protein